MDDKRLYFLDADGSDGKASLKTLAIARQRPKPEVFVAGVREFDLSRPQARLLPHLRRRPGRHAGGGGGRQSAVRRQQGQGQGG
jgi:hypothetical protein